MKMKSISGVVFYVKDIDKTADFYEALGFRFGKRDSDYLTCYLNWFWLEFHSQKEAVKAGSNQLVAVNVEDVDDFYQGLVDKGIKPQSEPEDSTFGRRQFILNDPDGNRLLFFQK